MTTDTPGQARINDFVAQGFLRLDNAFSPGQAAEVRELLWRAAGLSPDAPQGWTQPVVRIPHLAHPAVTAAANTPRLHAAWDALVGAGRWVAPRGLGSFVLRFPGGEDPGDTGWHLDTSFAGDDPQDFMRWRVNVTSRGRALLMLFLFTDVGAEDAPTRLRAGSHRVMARRLLPHGLAGVSLAELAAEGFEDSADCAQVAATGPAGTVYLCHPFLVHAAQPHRGRNPRFIAQPALTPAHDFDPALPPSPVQIAIRQACGLE